MTSNYPGALDSFTNPSGTSLVTSPDHAALHSSENDSIVAIQTTLGTNGGTSVLKNFVVGNLAVPANSSNVLQQTIAGGTLNSVVIGTSSITGGTFTLPQIKTQTIGSASYSPSNSTTQNLDLSTASRHLVNMSNTAGSVTLTVSNTSSNQPFFVEILQGTAGLGTINWFSTIRWAGSVTPTQTLTASRKDTFGFITTGAATFDGYIVGQNI